MNHQQEYRELNRKVQLQLRRDKTDYITQICSEVERESAANHSKSVYKNIKLLTKKPVPRLNVLKGADGKVITEDFEIKARWKQYCQNLYASQESNHTDDNTHHDVTPEPEILRSEVEQAIKKLKSGKSPGDDNIPAELLKQSGNEGITVIHKLCNKIWSTTEWPADWKKAVFLPLPKKGDTRECANNRTIALISHASKILLHIIAERIRDHLENELSPEQAGFRKGTQLKKRTVRRVNRA